MASFYRFRSVDALLGKYQELERQEIYFSPPQDLNDPIEGYKDLFWRGDEIVWRNLLKHYVLRLLLAYVVTKVSGKDHRRTFVEENAFVARLALPTPEIREIYRRICERFFGSHGIDEVPALLARSEYPLGRDALEFCLRAVHRAALDSVLAIYREDGLESWSPPEAAVNPSQADVVEGMKRVLSRLAEEELTAEALTALFSVGGHMAKQMELLAYLRQTDDHARAWQPLFTGFPEQYVSELANFVFFKWYAACFVADPGHAAMWGNYGDAHRGVCLQFRGDPGADAKPMLKLHGVIGASGSRDGVKPLYGDMPLPFEPVRYANKLPTIDFFRSLTRAPIPDLKSDWYTDDMGNVSVCAEGVFSSNAAWSADRWAAFLDLTMTKLRDWEHEREYRLVLTSSLELFADPADRKLRYNFSDLEGIIFGIKTPLEHKEQIIKLMLAKCEQEGRKEFAFSQASYAPYSGRIEIRPLDLLLID